MLLTRNSPQWQRHTKGYENNISNRTLKQAGVASIFISNKAQFRPKSVKRPKQKTHRKRQWERRGREYEHSYF